MDADTTTGATVAKRLASCNKSVRERALRLLRAWLSSPSASSVSDDDLLKIWKGLFYCVWHADKLPVQLDLINRLASLLLSLETGLSARYFDAFLVTIRREWSGIDHLRLDKFYLLIRRFFHHLFLLLSRSKWKLGLVERFISVMEDKSLLSVDKFPSQGVNYHISQVFLEEIKSFLPMSEEAWNVVLRPFISVLKKTSDKVLVGKIKVNIFDILLENGLKYLSLEKAGQGVDAGSEVDKFGKVALLLGLSKKFIDCASDLDTFQGNRKFLFALHEGFLKLEKDLENSGIQITIKLENGSFDSASATSVNEAAAQASDEISSKKKKKMKAKKNVSGEEKNKKPKKKKSSIPLDATPTNTSTDSGKASAGVTDNGDSVICDEMMTSNNTMSDSVNVTHVNPSCNNGEVSHEAKENVNSVTLDEVIMSSLQKQFERAAAESGMMTPVDGATAKKRKRVKSVDSKVSSCPKDVTGGRITGKSGENSSIKRVRFSMKNNIVWKPQSPLPPQSVRLPPSSTPRGSALKKGLAPGPVRESPPSTKKIKVKSSSVKKARPSIKRLWKF